MKVQKVTSLGVKVTLDDTEVVVRYSKTCISGYLFKNKQDAKVFLSKFRKGNSPGYKS